MIRNIAVRVSLVCALVLGAAVVVQAEAAHQTLVTFSSAVELPGQVLPAGTYEFRMMTADVVQVFTRDGRAIGSFLTIPTNRAKQGEGTEFTLDERSGDAAKAVSEWFQQGATVGVRFLYEK